MRLDTSCELFHGLSESEQVSFFFVSSSLFEFGFELHLKVLLTHGDSVIEATVAPGFKVIATSGGHVAGKANMCCLPMYL